MQVWHPVWLFVVLWFDLLASSSCATDELVQSSAQLSIISSFSSISRSNLSNPTKFANVVAGYYSGCLDACAVEGTSLIINGYEHGTEYYDPSLFTAFIIHRLEGDTLVELDRFYSPYLESTANVAISPVSSRPFIVRSSRLSHTYKASVFRYNTSTGLINKSPLTVLDISSLSPHFWAKRLTYHGCVGFSTDARFLMFTTTVSANGVDPTDQLMGILALSDDGTKLANVANTTIPRPTQGNGIYYPQPRIIMRPDDNESFYHIVVAFDYILPGDPTVVTRDSLLASYRFYPDPDHFEGTNTKLVMTGSVPSPQFVQGYDLSPDLQHVITYTNAMGLPGRSVQQEPVGPYNNSSPDPLCELRLHTYNPSAIQNALQFVSGAQTHSFGFQVRFSHSGHLVAVTSSPSVLLKATTLFSFAPGFSTGVLSVYTVEATGDRSIGLRLQTLEPAAPLALNIAWAVDDSGLAVVGQPTPIQTDMQYWAVTESNKTLFQ